MGKSAGLHNGFDVAIGGEEGVKGSPQVLGD